MQFVDLETARTTDGLRLVLLAGVPSPWSQAAKAIVELKRIPAVAVRLRPKDADVRAWTGAHNAPVALYRDEPPRSGWAEILALCERLDATVPLVPADADARIRMYGLCHELMGEGGMLWSSRLLMIEAGLTTDGAAGFSVPVARHLAARYGYTPGCGAAARARVDAVLGELGAQLERATTAGYSYYLGDQPTALDIYSATALNTLVPLSEADCPTHPSARSGFEWMRTQVGDAVPPALMAHRDRLYETHMSLPLEL